MSTTLLLTAHAPSQKQLANAVIKEASHPNILDINLV